MTELESVSDSKAIADCLIAKIPLQLATYHCQNDPSLLTPFGEGFPHLPIQCPYCNQIVDNYDDLSFDIVKEVAS